MKKFSMFMTAQLIPALVASQGLAQTIYDNGPLSTGAVSSSGVAAPAGTTWSEVQDDGGLLCSNTSAGFTCASLGVGAGFRLADDFTVPAGQTWNITGASVYAYQTGGAGLPFTAVTFQIWNGRPGDAGAAVIFGDSTTNRLTSQAFANLYRVFNTTTPAPGTPPNTTRAIQELRVAAVVSLGPGTYWIDFDTEVTNQLTHFSPSTTFANVRGQAGANGRQQLQSLVWQDQIDAGNPATCDDFIQETAFQLRGTIVTTGGCYPNCDGTGGLTANDFQCFLDAYAANASYANCDGVGGLTANDFQCFLNAYAAGCT